MPALADRVTVFAPAKINLFLHVGEKRADGFHALQSLVAFADVGDEIAISPAEQLTLAVEGPFSRSLEGEGDNLVLRSARALAVEARRSDGAAITLTKNLPVSSGIGGGSSDAAATLKALVRLWSPAISPDAFRRIVESLGSDVPVCFAGRTSWMEGRGELVTPAGAMPPLPAVLANPGVAVPTGKVFGALKTRRGTDGAKPMGWKTALDLVAFLKTTSNDLEAPALAIAPVIGEALDALRNSKGAQLARMSGSGATCFALFASDAAAVAAAARLKADHPDWWVVATTIGAAT